MMSDGPPRGYPPILLDLDYPAESAREISEQAAIEDGHLVLRGGGPNTVGGHPFSGASYRDTVLDVSFGLVAGDDNDLAGVFLRQSAERRYVAAAISPAGYVYVATVDGEGHPVAEGPLSADIPFERGMGAWNRLTIVAFGPSLVVVLNGSILVHLAVDQRYAAGAAGLFLQQGGTSTEARAAARWVQVRAVLADQK
jgi:hypothetical protein